jgi:hypothetical protein
VLLADLAGHAARLSQLAKRNQSGEGYFVGMGHWTRPNPELCLLAKGSSMRLAKDVQQLIVSPVGRHSENRIRAGEILAPMQREDCSLAKYLAHLGSYRRRIIGMLRPWAALWR